MRQIIAGTRGKRARQMCFLMAGNLALIWQNVLHHEITQCLHLKTQCLHLNVDILRFIKKQTKPEASLDSRSSEFTQISEFQFSDIVCRSIDQMCISALERLSIEETSELCNLKI